MIHLSMRKILFVLCSWIPIVACSKHGQVITGAQQLDAYLPILQGKNVVLVVNQTSQVDQMHLVELLLARGVTVAKVFTPEHGFKGQLGAGELVNDTINQEQVEIVSLYNVLRLHKKLLPVMLEGVDIVVFDLQDVGVRFYTHLTVLHYVMEACAACAKPLLVLDRPNPNGHYVDGPVLEKELRSFVGIHPIPLVYGLTIGELAGMINGEGWLEGGLSCKLQVIPLKNYTHLTPYVLPIKPSPNLNTQQAILLYPSLGLFEGTTVSVGRGTLFPFQVLGYPDARWGAFSFVPISIPEMDKAPKYKGQTCYGLDLRDILPGCQIDLSYLLHFYKKAKEQKIPLLDKTFDTHAGNKLLRQQLEAGLTEASIRTSWQPELERYKTIRKKYLLYPDQ